jgi:hypothetical protein
MKVRETITIGPEQLPQSPITPADLVGRAFRITRLNWRVLIRLFIVPSFLYGLSDFCADWIGEHTSVGPKMMVATGLFSLVLLFVSRCWIYERTYGLLLVLNGDKDDFDSALKEATAKRPMILFLILPILLADIGLLILTAVAAWLTQASDIGRSASSRHDLLGGLLYGFQILVGFPLECLSLLCVLFFATLIAEKLTLLGCCKRSAWLLWQGAGYVSIYFVLFTILYYALSLPIGVLACLYPLAEALSGSVKEFATASAMLLECCLMAPLDAFVFAATAVGSAALYGQLTMRLEFRDVLHRLSLIKSAVQ